MKAIVMTCDKYRPFTEHMLKTYEKHWPSNTFTFRVPYNEHKGDLENIPNVELIKSPVHIKHTVLKLLEDIPDDEWIYWCIDDKYIIELDEKKANEIETWIDTIKDPSIAGIRFYGYETHEKTRCLKKNTIETSIGELREVKDYYRIWLNQFVQAGIIRHLFKQFPDTHYPAKKMDLFLRTIQLPKGKHLYIHKENYCVSGESTISGKITQNCLNSFKSYDLEKPKEFQVAHRSIIRGSNARNVFLKKPLHKKISSFFKKMRRK